MDIRTPIGLMFLVKGLLLLGYSFVSDAAIYERSLGINVNMGWGAVLLVFGAIMLMLGRSGGSVVGADH
jgi:hypothetical protein